MIKAVAFVILALAIAQLEAAAIDYEYANNSILVTDAQLRSLGAELFTLDQNNVRNIITVAAQGRGTGCPGLASDRLMTVNTAAYSRPTIARLLPLFNHFRADVNIAETFTAAQTREQNEFIDAVFNTPVMRRAETFLQQNGLPSGRANFVRNWFDLYSRGNGALGSNGFEHVFMAETRDGSIMGAHQWIWFDDQNRRGILNYRGHRSFVGTIGGVGTANRASGIASIFNWRGFCKPISSLFIGTSPEFELAIFNVCYHARRNGLCPVTLGGTNLNIQTFDITRSGRTFVSTAYPVIN
jgi:poly(U)-specific endoribonuclease